MGPTSRRLAEEFTAACNEAHRVLSDPLSRAAYLLSLRGHDPFDEGDGHKLPPDFLERQLELREELEDIAQGKSEAAAAKFATQLGKEIDAELASLADLIDNKPDDPLPAVACAQRLRYLQNCHKEASRLVGN
jgi:molecular chaperone HscB